MSDAREAACLQKATMAAALRRAGGDGGTAQAEALAENGEAL
ncbi:hypothetical protein [Streptomyces sp. NPDC051776]